MCPYSRDIFLTGYVDYEAERKAIVELYQNYVKYFNSKQRIEVFKLWTAEGKRLLLCGHVEKRKRRRKRA